MTSEPTKESKPDNAEGRRVVFCAVSGTCGGIAALAFSIAMQQGLHFWFTMFPAEGMIPPSSPTVDEFVYRMREHLVFAIFCGSMCGFASSLLPRRMQSPLPLAVLWGSLLGSLGLIAAVNVVTYDRDTQPLERVAIVLFFAGMGAVYGFVMGVSIRVLEVIRARMTPPPPVSPEPPR